jgi:hypothetical protein
MGVLKNLFKNNRVVGVVGSRSSGKTSLVLSELIELKDEMNKDKIKLPIYVFGVEETLKPYLKSKGINFLYSRDDILDLKIRNAIIFCDEIANFFSTATKDRETDKFKRFINRIEHQNCFFIMATAETGFYNKLACSLINSYLVKTCEFDNLVNGTFLKRLIMGLENCSDYRLDIPKNTYYTIEGKSLTTKHTYTYNKDLDSKKNNINPFK